MTRLEQGIAALQHALSEIGVVWALVGGLAVSIRTSPRTTRDVDIAVAAADDEEATAIVRGLQERGYRVLRQVEQEAAGRLALVELAAPGAEEGEIRVDALFALSGIEAEVARDAELLRIFPGLSAPVARIPHLIALKTLAVAPGREQDRIDLRRLAREASPAEIDEARSLLRLVAARGFDRKKDLEAELDGLLATLPE